jgi:hypothetical protein
MKIMAFKRESAANPCLPENYLPEEGYPKDCK